MKVNKQALFLANITEADFKRWCKENNKAQYKQSVKADFFARIADGRLVKDSSTGKLVKKYRKKPRPKYYI